MNIGVSSKVFFQNTVDINGSIYWFGMCSKPIQHRGCSNFPGFLQILRSLPTLLVNIHGSCNCFHLKNLKIWQLVDDLVMFIRVSQCHPPRQENRGTPWTGQKLKTRINLKLPWKPRTFIFRGYELWPTFSDLKPWFFHGFWGPMCVSFSILFFMMNMSPKALPKCRHQGAKTQEEPKSSLFLFTFLAGRW